MGVDTAIDDPSQNELRTWRRTEDFLSAPKAVLLAKCWQYFVLRILTQNALLSSLRDGLLALPAGVLPVPLDIFLDLRDHIFTFTRAQERRAATAAERAANPHPTPSEDRYW
jgi:hypothetical protein